MRDTRHIAEADNGETDKNAFEIAVKSVADVLQTGKPGEVVHEIYDIKIKIYERAAAMWRRKTLYKK
jgi:hypothetical protein